MLGTQQAPLVLENNFTQGENLSLASYQSREDFPSPAGRPESIELDISEYIGGLFYSLRKESNYSITLL